MASQVQEAGARSRAAPPLDETAILNVFIKTIFDPGSSFSVAELQVHEALRSGERRLGGASVGDLRAHLKRLSPKDLKTAVLGVKYYLQQH